MSSKKWLALAAWALLPFAATAQEKHSSATPAPAAASARALDYQSAFSDYRSFNEEDATPDKLWRPANDEMGTLGGHAGHMKVAPAVTTSRNEPPAVQPSGGRDHSKHHGGSHQ